MPRTAAAASAAFARVTHGCNTAEEQRPEQRERGLAIQRGERATFVVKRREKNTCMARQIEDGGTARRTIAGGRENGSNLGTFNLAHAVTFRDAVDNVGSSDVIEDQRHQGEHASRVNQRKDPSWKCRPN